MLEVVGNSQTLLLGNVLLDPFSVQLQRAISLQIEKKYDTAVSKRHPLRQTSQDLSGLLWKHVVLTGPTLRPPMAYFACG